MTFRHESLKLKNLYPNPDLYLTVISIMIGIQTKLISSLPVMARISGICAHILEQKYINNKNFDINY